MCQLGVDIVVVTPLIIPLLRRGDLCVFRVALAGRARCPCAMLRFEAVDQLLSPESGASPQLPKVDAPGIVVAKVHAEIEVLLFIPFINLFT